MNFTQETAQRSVRNNHKSNPMAELSNRLPQNVPGRFYVDDTCIDCDNCRSTGPAFFTRDDETGYSYVFRQPRTPEEVALAEEGRLACPTDSIGNDGSVVSVSKA
jgi:ferredoxin